MRALKAFFIPIFFLLSCEPVNEQEENFLNTLEELSYFVDLEEAPAFLLMHVQDCSPCLESVANFIKVNFRRDKLVVVISSSSSKLVNLAVHNYGLDEFKIITDSKELIKRKGITQGSLPVFVFFNKEGNMEVFELGLGNKGLNAELLEFEAYIKEI
jgi:thioredoxin-related protein